MEQELAVLAVALSTGVKQGSVGWAGPLHSESLIIKMHDIALKSNGAKMVMATSQDERFPPDNMIDGKPNTFWTTTGMYPQCFILALPNVATVETISIHSYNIKKLKMEKTSEPDPIRFELFSEIDMNATDESVQKITIGNERHEARYLRFIIESGHDHFCAVYKIQVEGSLM